MVPKNQTPGKRFPGVETSKNQPALNAERAAAAASALDVRVVELEARTFDGLDVIDRDAVEIHFAHLIDEYLQAFELIDIVAVLINLILESHVVAETRASATHHGHAQPCRAWVLRLDNLFDLRDCHRR